MKLTINEKSYEVELQPDGVAVGGTSFKTTVLRDNGEATVKVAGRPYKVKIKDEKTIIVDGRPFTVEVIGQAASVKRQAANAAKKPAKDAKKDVVGCAEVGAVRALMPGTVLALRVQEGQPVTVGTVLLILEAMKMQNEIKAPIDGVAKRILVASGQTVKNGDVMVVIE